MRAALYPFFHFHEARAVLQYNGVKTNISPRVLYHAENIMNNPLLLHRDHSFHGQNVHAVCQARRDVGLLASLRGHSRGADTGASCPREEDPRVPVARRRAVVPTLSGQI